MAALASIGNESVEESKDAKTLSKQAETLQSVRSSINKQGETVSSFNELKNPAGGDNVT